MSLMKPIPFVEGWEFVQTLGEGAYGEVKLAVCQATLECVAVKIINLKNKGVEETVRKEVCIHKMLDHKNVIKFFGFRKAEKVEYLFLKYASGGELFDRIEPDEGMKTSEALRHFRNLIEGVQYLHSRGVCHRDLKPENLLLDENDVLQITDFGMATIFRYQGQERELNRMCGTLPYTSPEVLKNQFYRAEPTDVWSCGIVLVTLLAGELPWDAPRSCDKLYRNWKERKITTSPWNKIDTLALSLCRSVLIENPSRRYTIPQIMKHQFYNKSFPLQEEEENMTSPSATNPTKRRRLSVLEDSGRLSSPTGITASQPDIISTSNDNTATSRFAEVCHPISFSQPAQTEDMLLNSQISTPANSQTPFQKLVRRLTRFSVITGQKETFSKMSSVLEVLGYSVRKNPDLMLLTMTTVDRRKSQLVFKACLIEMAGNILVDFRLSKGDGLEFKRHFVRIKNKLKPIIKKTSPHLFLNIGSAALPNTSSQPSNTVLSPTTSSTSTATTSSSPSSETAVKSTDKSSPLLSSKRSNESPVSSSPSTETVTTATETSCHEKSPKSALHTPKKRDNLVRGCDGEDSKLNSNTTGINENCLQNGETLTPSKPTENDEAFERFKKCETI